MLTRSLLQQIFPEGAIQYIHPTAGWFEVNGLFKETQPNECAILARGQDKHARPGERREHFLVNADGVLLFFRICTAQLGSDYAEFAVGRAAALATGLEGEALEAHARDTIETLCGR